MKTEYPMQIAAKERPDSRRSQTRSSVRPDEELLATYTETGNRDAFEELVHRYERELYSYLRQFLGDAQLAEDAFQTTFLQVHLKCRQFAPGRRFRPWLYAIAAHQAVDLLRRNRRHKAMSLTTVSGDGVTDDERRSLDSLVETEEADPSERLKVIEDCDWTRSALKKIPAKLRQVLMLVVYKGLSYQKAAELLGIPLGTVKSRMNSAIASLHKALIATNRRVSTGTRHRFSLPGA
jgi:RNA polymerase sigma-70 factor, ECF subfamily